MANRLLSLARSCSTVDKHISHHENQQRTARVLRKNMKSAVFSHLCISSSMLNMANFSNQAKDFIAGFSENCLKWLNACDALKDSLCHLKSYNSLVLLALRSLTRNNAAASASVSDPPKDCGCCLREKKNLSKSRKILAECVENIRCKSQQNSKLEECSSVLRKMKNTCRSLPADKSDGFVASLHRAHVSTTLVCYAAVNALLLMKTPHKQRIVVMDNAGRDHRGISDSCGLLFEFYSVHSGVMSLCNLLDEEQKCESKIRACVERLHGSVDSLGKEIVEVSEQVQLLHRLLVCNRMSFMGILTGHNNAPPHSGVNMTCIANLPSARNFHGRFRSL